MSGKSLGTFIHLVVVSRALYSEKRYFPAHRGGPNPTLTNYGGHHRIFTGIDDMVLWSMGHLLNSGTHPLVTGTQLGPKLM